MSKTPGGAVHKCHSSGDQTKQEMTEKESEREQENGVWLQVLLTHVIDNGQTGRSYLYSFSCIASVVLWITYDFCL